jgi:hypothetical protein
MADSWERSHGLNPADGTDHNRVMASGYTAIEEYVNERAAALLSGSDLQPPTVSVTRPASGSALSDLVTLEASATDSVAVAGVQFLVDGTPRGPELTTAPYTYELDLLPLASGSHTIAAQARDAAGNVGRSSGVTVTVSNSCADLASGQSTNGAVGDQMGTFTARWSSRPGANGMDGGVGMANGAATIWANAAAIVLYDPTGYVRARDYDAYRSTANYPYAQGKDYRYRMQVNVPAKTYSVWVRLPGSPETQIASNYRFRDTQQVSRLTHWLARAETGGLRACNFRVEVAADTQPPAVSVISPTSGQTVRDAQTLEASASDNVGVAGVQFLVDGANRGPEITAAPYRYELDVLALPNGSHQIAARARDGAGNTQTSALVAVTVDNTCNSIAAGGSTNASVGTQTGSFTVRWTARPGASPMDGGVGLSNGAASFWANAAAIVLFDPSGYLRVRDYDAYRAVTNYAYAQGTDYRFRVAVNVPNKTYSAWVALAGGAETQIATNYRFRDTQQVTQITHWLARAESGGIRVCNVRLQ